MLHVLVYCDLTTLNARTLPAEALDTEVLCVEGWLTCVHADTDQHKEEKQHLLGVWMMDMCVHEDVLPADAD